MEAYKIPKAKWPVELHAILKDEALVAFMTVPPADINNYEPFKYGQESLDKQSATPAPDATQTRLDSNSSVQTHLKHTNTSQTPLPLAQFSEGMTLQQFISHSL